MKTQNLIMSLLMFSFPFVFAQYENVAIDTNSATQNEITIAISPVNSNYLKASWNEYRNSYPKTEPGYAFSTDGGLNWSDGIVPDTGIYLYRLSAHGVSQAGIKAGQFMQTRKMMVLK